MLISKEETLRLTGHDLESELLAQAQGIIEMFVGRTEAQVDDPDDVMFMGRAVAYQAAYMHENADTVFTQYAVNQISQSGNLIGFRYDDIESPFIARLASFACKNLSWRRARAINTGKIHSVAPVVDGWDKA